ncbi:MAG: ABC transporter transmembrane domain-containing protein, partial [Oscillospiraceae bacterium]
MAQTRKADTQTAPAMPMRPGGGGGGGGGRMMMRGGEKPKNFSDTFKKFVKYLGAYKVGIIFVMVLASLSSLFKVIGPKVLGAGTDILYSAVENSLVIGSIVIDYGALLKIVLTLTGLYLISYVFSVAQGFTMAKISNNITYRFRRDIDEKINRLPLSFFDKTSTGDVLSRITNDVDSINQSI